MFGLYIQIKRQENHRTDRLIFTWNVHLKMARNVYERSRFKVMTRPKDLTRPFVIGVLILKALHCYKIMKHINAKLLGYRVVHKNLFEN